MSEAPQTLRGPAGVMLLARLLIGIALIFIVPALCVDDDMRTFYSHWWFNLPSFSPSRFWLPGQFYVYGVVDGLAGDMILVPRFLTLGLHLATAAAAILLGAGSSRSRMLAAGIIMFSPLSLVLGTVPLSETLFALAAVGAVVFLERWSRGGTYRNLGGAAALFVAASAIRYEGWALLPVLPIVVSASRRREGARAVALKAASALSLAVFPAAWMLWWRAGEGDALGFLDNIETDSFGAGSLVEGLRDPRSWIGALVAALGLAAVVARFVNAIRRRALAEAVPELTALFAAGMLAWALITSNVPSQYPVRMLFPLTILSAIPLARSMDAAISPGRFAAPILLLAGGLMVVGLTYAASLAPGYHEPSRAAGRRIAELLEGGRVSAGERVIVEKRLPEAYGLVVHSNSFEAVRIDNMGSWCPGDYLRCAPDGVPEPVRASRLSIVWSARARAYLSKLGWRPAAADGPWTLFARPKDASPLGTCPQEPTKHGAASVTGGD